MLFGGIVIIGGIKTIGKVTSFFVPIMAGFYLIAGLIVMVMNFNLIPEAFATIFKFAFTGEAAVGGVQLVLLFVLESHVVYSPMKLVSDLLLLLQLQLKQICLVDKHLFQ